MHDETKPGPAVQSAEPAAASTAPIPPPERSRLLSREWLALLFTIISFVVAQIIVVSLHYRLTRINQATEQVKLVREMYKQFYLDEKSYLQIAGAIESCQKLYRNDGGSFTHVQINDYLGFFTDLGLFMERGALHRDLIGHFFGAFIIEAYEYPEVKTYIARTRKNFHQPEAFAGFDAVAQAIAKEPRFAGLVSFAKTMCPDQSEETPSP